MEGQRTKGEVLADRNAEQKWRPHGRESLRRPEITGDQPATSRAFTKEGTLVGGNWAVAS